MDETKYCILCDRNLPLEYFDKDKTSNDSRHTQCKECKRNSHFSKTYGITLKEYDNMFEE